MRSSFPLLLLPTTGRASSQLAILEAILGKRAERFAQLELDHVLVAEWGNVRGAFAEFVQYRSNNKSDGLTIRSSHLAKQN